MRIRLAITGLLALALASDAPAFAAAARTIVIDNLAFGPTPTGLHVGDAIEWRNADTFRHTATATDGSFDIDLPPGAKRTIRLEKAGAINFYCRFHPGMKGQFRVDP